MFTWAAYNKVNPRISISLFLKFLKLSHFRVPSVLQYKSILIPLDHFTCPTSLTCPMESRRLKIRLLNPRPLSFFRLKLANPWTLSSPHFLPISPPMLLSQPQLSQPAHLQAFFPWVPPDNRAALSSMGTVWVPALRQYPVGQWFLFPVGARLVWSRQKK